MNHHFKNPADGVAGAQHLIDLYNSGEIAGVYSAPTYGTIAFVRDASGNITTFDPPSTTWLEQVKVNSVGQITGYGYYEGSFTHSFFRNAEGALFNFDAPGASTAASDGTFGADINDNGDIGGWFVDTNYASHGFVRNAVGTFTVFDVPGAARIANVAAINISGEIAGTYIDAANVYTAFIRDATGNITSFVDSYAGTKPVQGTLARCMNRYGAIAGNYIAGGGKWHGFFREGQ